MMKDLTIVSDSVQDIYAELGIVRELVRIIENNLNAYDPEVNQSANKALIAVVADKLEDQLHDFGITVERLFNIKELYAA